jgi:prepilin-type N-terminal cleavage/methylation domain-containing protein
VKKETKSGYSLLEIIFVMMILSALAALALHGFAGQRERATSEALARVLSAELGAARTKALRSASPVAFCFPSDGGKTPLSQAFYLMEGKARPEVTKVQPWVGDYPKAMIANVYWGSAELPTSSGEVKRATLMSSWLGTKIGQDYALIFLPDGSVVSNDLPQTDGKYRILVASSVTAKALSVSGSRHFAPSPNHFQLTKAFAGHTITVSPDGRIETISGVIDPSGVDILAAAIPSSQGQATLSIPAKDVDTKPLIDTVTVAPAPFLEPKATVQKDRNLSLFVAAADLDGDPLFCTWEATPESGSTGTGFFSLPDNHPMLWDPATEKWVSNCTWAPPPPCSVGDKYVLTCKVTDANGNEVLAEEEILDPVTIIPPGTIVFDQDTLGASGISTINSDGTDLRDLTNTGAGAAISPDGSKIAWSNKEDGPKNQIWVMDIDGSNKRQLSNFIGSKGALTWSGDGTYVLFSNVSLPGRDTIWAVKANGTGGGDIYTGPGSSAYAQTFSPDGELFVYTAYVGAPGVAGVNAELGVAEFVDAGGTPSLKDLSLVTNNAAAKIMDMFVTWIPGAGREFIYLRASQGASFWFEDATYETVRAKIVDTGVSGTARFRIDEIDVQPGNEFLHPKRYSPLMRPASMAPIFSPDGSQVIYGKHPGGLFIADWKDLGNASLNLTNERPLSPRPGGSQTVKAWVP